MSILVLITILSVICLLTYFISARQKKLLRQLTNKQEPRFDVIHHQAPPPSIDYQSKEEEGENFDHMETSFDPIFQPKATCKKNTTDKPVPKKTSSAEEIIYLMLIAKPNKPYCGYELLQSLLATGLRFGAMDIFHRHEDVNGKGKILFSVASASEPGTFEINKMGAFSGKGLTMFLRLSSNKDLMQAFDTMLETAKQLIEDLNGDIMDDERNILSPEKIEKIRDKIVNFEQKQLIGDLFDQ